MSRWNVRKASLVACLAVAVVALLLARAESLPAGPQPIAWDREPCGHCHMLIGDKRFAAQIITADGQVVSFDDPGCLTRYVDERKPRVHQTWFHHVREDRWL